MDCGGEELTKILDCIIIKVSNIDDAYKAFIRHYREQLDIPVVAITVATGKTTTKDMVKHISGTWYKVEGTVDRPTEILII